ncbi:MAG: Gfo/Idh/MocA family oxidoreductase [Anaerolineae bacterium]|nr:Gfo/Idh/MocA family oxidoreductase [Anaerolineae bacterium]
MSAKVKIAVVGTGWWSTTAHIPALLANPRVDLVLIDKNPTALNAAADKYNVRTAYTSVPEAVAAHPDLKGAIVAVQHQYHDEAGKQVLDHGLHLLMEKPMTLTAKGAKALVELAASKGVQILMGYTFPYLAPIQTAKRYIDEGLLGEIEYITCSMTSMTIEFYRGKPAEYAEVMNYPVHGPGNSTYSDPRVAGGGQAHLQITHSAAMMFYLASGLRAEKVSAFMGNLDTKVDVVDAFAVRMNNGAVATVGSTGNIGKGDGGIVEVHLHGSKGRLRVDAITGELHMRLHDGREERIAPHSPGYPGSLPSQRFVDMILDGAPNEFPGATNGLYTVELLEAAYRSAAQEGMPVKVASLYA